MGLLLGTASAQAGSLWDSWWHTADQQGEKLMQQGNAAAAAHTFTDPQRKAYAELLAGDYAHAAQDFSAFGDSDSNYNRGNALAHAGQLQEALKAYDAALARDPNNRDARHNRDLVAQELRRQPPQPQPSSGKNSSPKDDKQEEKQDGKSQPNSGNTGKQGDAEPKPSGQKRNEKGQQGKTGHGKEGGGTAPQAGQSQQTTAGATDSSVPQNGQPKSDDAAQAQRDAETALGKLPQGNKIAPSDAPVSEQQLAQEQWLRSIPDDPAGLLRRKFLIEHLIRQKGGQP